MIASEGGSDVVVRPMREVHGQVTLPGSKSLSHRHLVCAALADGVSTLRNLPDAEDVQVMTRGLQALGGRIEQFGAGTRITGSGGQVRADDARVQCGEAGAVLRFLSAVACLGHGVRQLDGAARLRERPLRGLLDALRVLGAEIEGNAPPLLVHARGLSGGAVNLAAVESSQFLSALLLVGPFCVEDLLVEVEGPLPSRPYVAATIHVMREYGVEVLHDGESRFIVPASQRYRAGEHVIEPDASSATYFWAAAAITGGEMCVRGLSRDSPQGDVRFVDVLEQMGCSAEATDAGLCVRAPAGGLRGVDIDMNAMPDAVPTLAVAALFARGTTTIRNIAQLRHKESDRLGALATELREFGAEVLEIADGLEIRPPEKARGAVVDTYNDHRIAMSFAIAGLACEGVIIRNADCVAKSFPAFFETLNSLGPIHS